MTDAYDDYIGEKFVSLWDKEKDSTINQQIANTIIEDLINNKLFSNNDVIKALNILAKAISTIIASRATEDNDENMEEDKKQKWIELKAKLLYKLTGHEILRQTKEKIGISKEEIYGSSIHREGNQDQSN